MHRYYKYAPLLLSLLTVTPPVSAAKNADNAVAAKLQAMVRQLTSERDAAKAENTKLTAENNQLQTQLSAAKQSADSAASTGNKLQGDLVAARSSSDRLQGQVETTRAKLQELMTVSKKLNQSKNQLTEQLAQLQQTHTDAANELETCSNKNIELLKTTKDIVANFNNKGLVSSLLGEEPVLGFNEVDIENQIQDYQDKLIAHRYLKKAETPVAPAPESSENPSETSENEKSH